MGITCCKGMRDILPAEMDSWYYLENIAFRLVEAYGYREIRTPLFESKELFTNCMGRDSGTVQNKLWTVKGNNGESWALRPDMTASTLRAYCEHRLYLDSAGPTKLFYLGPVFQHSSGRKSFNWQGYQFGLEALGTEDPSSDVEVIMMAHDLCQELGLPKVRVHINTLGCAHCRPVYQQMLSDFFARHSADLCPACLSRYKNRPLWVLGCPEERCRSVSGIVPSIHSCLCEDCEAHFRTVCAYLSELKVDYVIDPLVVRDVDCYNRTIFQVVCAGRLVAFGGRYDGMAGRMADSACEEADANAVGCSMDIEPLLNLMDEMNINVGKYAPCPKVCFVGDSREAVQLMLPVLYALRRSKVVAELKAEEISSEESLSKMSSARFVVGLQDIDVRNRMVTFYDGELDRLDRVSLDEALTIIGRELRIKNLPAELRPSDMRNWSIATRSHHTLDGNNRLRRPSEPKTRSRSRRLSLKTEQLLPASMRESRSRKNAGYPVAVTRDTMAVSHVRKRRRPENEDSLETTAAVPSENLQPGSYPEPVLSPARREKREMELPKSARSSRLNAGRSRLESAASREHKSERLLYGHSDKLKFSDVESLVYSGGTSRKQERLFLDKELNHMEFGGTAADTEHIVYYPEEIGIQGASVTGEKHGRRRMRAGKDSQRQSYVNSDVASLYVDDPFDKDADGSETERRPNIIQNINRWASERYGISEPQEDEALPVLKSGAAVRKESSRSRGGRQSLARNRELKALAAAGSVSETAAETVLPDSVPDTSVDQEKVSACDEEAAAALKQSPAGPEADEASQLPAPKPASAKKRGTSSKRRAAVNAAEEPPAETAPAPAELPPQNESRPSAGSSADDAAPAGSDDQSEGEAGLLPAATDAPLPAAKTKGRKGASTRRTLTAARRSSASSRRTGKKAAAEQASEPAAADAPVENNREPSLNTAENTENAE